MAEEQPLRFCKEGLNALDYLLDGLEAALELERELGVRAVEVDRSLLTVPPTVSNPRPLPRQTPQASLPSAAVEHRPAVTPSPKRPSVSEPSAAPVFDFVFIHDRPLSTKGVEMMAKIVTAMGRTEETAPIRVAPPIPKSRVYVVLGGLAMRKHFPGLAGSPGQWLKTQDGADVLVTYSPEYILRYPTVTDAVKKIKQEMWTSLKAVLQRIKA